MNLWVLTGGSFILLYVFWRLMTLTAEAFSAWWNADEPSPRDEGKRPEERESSGLHG